MYVSGEVLRRLLKASPAKRGKIVVADDNNQGYHIDVDVDMRNHGSLMWASRGTP